MAELLKLETKSESLKTYTMKELEAHNGSNGFKSWVSLKGVIYDVSANNVYDSSGGYNVFSGRDASYSLATMLFEKVADRNWRNCSKEHLECLEEWVLYYRDRYTKVGSLDDE